MTKEHVKYFSEVLGLTTKKVEKILFYLTITNKAWCFVDGQIIDKGFCDRYLELAKTAE